MQSGLSARAYMMRCRGVLGAAVGMPIGHRYVPGRVAGEK